MRKNEAPTPIMGGGLNFRRMSRKRKREEEERRRGVFWEGEEAVGMGRGAAHLLKSIFNLTFW